MKNDKKHDKVEIESEEYKGYIERLTAPPAPIKITQEQLEDFLLNSRLTIKSKDQHNVYIISGAPASGKTTYVQSKIKQGDLVFDLDAICAALGGTTELYEDHKPYLDTALRVRDVIYEQIEKRDGKWHDAYVITASNDSKFVEALAERLNGTVITMKATREQCIERAKKDKRRQANLDKQIEIINEWFDTRS